MFNLLSKLKVLSLFSIFSLSSIVITAIALIFVGLAKLGIFDLNGQIIHVVNEIMAKETGLPLEEIEDIEGVKHKKK